VADTAVPRIALYDGYYLDNFKFLLNFVCGRYQDLLTPAEIEYVQTFMAASEAAQRLYVRLVLRKGPWFRADKLNYPEINDLDQAASELISIGILTAYRSSESPVEDLVETDTDEIEQLLSLLTKQELIALLETHLEFNSKPSSLYKVELLALGCEHLSKPDILRAVQFSLFRPVGIENLELLKLLFFGNMYQDFTEFVLNDLGVTPFEQYKIDHDTRFFSRRSIVDDTVHLYHLNELSHQVIDNKDPEALLQVAEMANQVTETSLQRRKDRIVNRVARQLERLEQYPDALRLFETSKSAPSRERQARIYHSIFENIDQSIMQCSEIIANPEDEAEYEFAIKFGRRILKKHKRKIPESFPTLEKIAPVPVSLELQFDPDIRVEEATRKWYAAQGHQAAYVENALFTGVFGLIFWDIIFSPVRGVFFNPFQRGPVDLFSADFALQRETEIAGRLLEIEEANGASVRTRFLKTYADKQGIANFLVNWNVLDYSLVELALDRIPLRHFHSVFSRLLADLKSNRSGLPDLIIFPKQGGYRLIEVKGPGDKLQNNQTRWIRHFQREKMPIEVVNVQWA